MNILAFHLQATNCRLNLCLFLLLSNVGLQLSSAA